MNEPMITQTAKLRKRARKTRFQIARDAHSINYTTYAKKKVEQRLIVKIILDFATQIATYTNHIQINWIR
ncbi:hypothetical protein D0T85_09255 [Bacteroides sp. 519]|nr:hypothetical protein [Bacteroides sp. 519]